MRRNSEVMEEIPLIMQVESVVYMTNEEEMREAMKRK